MGEYVTIQGDTWDGISYKLYGDSSQMTALMTLNPTHNRTVFFSSGILLMTPNVKPQQAGGLPPWKDDD